jgi:alpha-glucosidase
MLWDGSRNAGFCPGEPWLRVDRSFRRRNVEVEKKNEYSHLCLYQKLIGLRQQEPSLMTGAYRPVYSDPQLLAYIRQAEGQPGFLVVLNLTHRPCYFIPSTIRFTGVIIVDTFPEQEQVSVQDTIDLFGDEGLIVKLDEWQEASANPSVHELSANP